tara:strand:+ start:187 stop:507 length:321 start_codon:yes stop_codon:yes gene_type:complete
MNKFVLNVLVLFSLLLFSFPAHSQSYEEAVGAHVITETLVGGGVDHQKIMANELERIMHRHTIEVLGVLSEHLPHVLKGLQTELKLKADLKYKCSLLEGTKYPCEE